MPHSTVLTLEQEAIIVAFRATRCFRWTTASMPSTLDPGAHRLLCTLACSGMDLAAAGPGRRQPAKKMFKSYPIGFFHIDIAEVRTGEGKL
jgi:hypothetical protein